MVIVHFKPKGGKWTIIESYMIIVYSLKDRTSNCKYYAN